MSDLKSHNLDKVVKLIVTLPYKDGPKRLADLAVNEDAVKRICHQCDTATFQQLRDKDPTTLAPETEHLILNNFVGIWLDGRLRWIDDGLDHLGSSIETVRIWHFACQGPLVEDAKKKNIRHMILAVVQLEDPSNGYAPAQPSCRPPGAIVVDLAVLPEHAPIVRSKYSTVGFILREDHPLVCSQPGENNDIKIARACRKILFRYDRVKSLRQPQAQIPEPKINELISNWLNRRIKSFEQYIELIHGCETMHAIIAAVPLLDPIYRRLAEDSTIHSEGVVPVDLAVRRAEVARVRDHSGSANFIVMPPRDPVISCQPSEDANTQQIAALNGLLAQYSRYLRDEYAALSPMARIWAIERQAELEYQLSVLQPSHLVTVRFCCPTYQSHPWEIIMARGLGDVVREVIILNQDDHINSQESTQVDLAVEPSGVLRVSQLCELVECQRWGDDDPIIQMQHKNDPRGKRIGACTHALQQYIKARRSRQTDEALMQWYRREITALRDLIVKCRHTTLRPCAPRSSTVGRNGKAVAREVKPSQPPPPTAHPNSVPNGAENSSTDLTVTSLLKVSPPQADSSGRSMHMLVQMPHTHHVSICENDMGNVGVSEQSSTRQLISTHLTHNVRDKFWGMRKCEVGNHSLAHLVASGVGASHGHGYSEGLPAPDSNCFEISPRLSLDIRDVETVYRYYEKTFSFLHSHTCRIIAKSLIKLVKSRDKVRYLYSGDNIATPPWWPHDVRRVEPGHLRKQGADKVKNVLVSFFTSLLALTLMSLNKLWMSLAKKSNRPKQGSLMLYWNFGEDKSMEYEAGEAGKYPYPTETDLYLTHETDGATLVEVIDPKGIILPSRSSQTQQRPTSLTPDNSTDINNLLSSTMTGWNSYIEPFPCSPTT
ncbi:hypothetical protein FE257_004339 [Aspergillus nanangensis]|uniref:Subtelomeric hrmA-associated cluster protein AFUB-079030/YDR124W-like helical bundle domain-containing protein n=1 Tax=Aspergillus nanangensis TaxID=2582783 RepID=A0AAD4CAQ8_ASPNN|nr:hypothetical protein FE257_004339 [Aspergillus nanangensis]